MRPGVSHARGLPHPEHAAIVCVPQYISQGLVWPAALAKMRVTRHAAGSSGAAQSAGRWAGSPEPAPSTPCRQAGGLQLELATGRREHYSVPVLLCFTLPTTPPQIPPPTHCMSCTKASSPAYVAVSGPGSSARGGTSGRSPSSTTQRRTCKRGGGEFERKVKRWQEHGTGPSRGP